jgi:hypothetical protein
METFEYEPLPRGDDGQWIRLIELRCGQGSDKIECSIQHANLADNPQYEAISYCWGDPTIRSTISCSDGRHVTVTANLYAALSAIRSEDENRLLWADALCIYQDRYRSKCCRNLRFEPRFCEGVGFAHLACQIGKFTLRVFIIEIYQYIAFYLYLTIC